MAASFWVSPLGEELHGLDVKPLSGCDVLTVGQLHCSLDGAGQALVQAGGARRPHQLQARADHIAHNCRVKHTKQEDSLSPGKLQFLGKHSLCNLTPNRVIQEFRLLLKLVNVYSVSGASEACLICIGQNKRKANLKVNLNLLLPAEHSVSASHCRTNYSCYVVKKKKKKKRGVNAE